MAVADGAILRIVASLLFPESVIAQNVFYAVFTDTGTSDDEQDVVDDLATWIEAVYDTINAQISDLVALTGLKVYVYDSIDDDWDEVGDAVLTDAFEAASEMLPHGVAYLCHAKTTDPDVQASKFIGGMAEQTSEDGTWSSSTMTNFALFGAEWVGTFVGGITGADFAPVVWSTAQGVAKLFSGTIILNATPAYQRRRKPGVGI
jgi:hypothetical protein